MDGLSFYSLPDNLCSWLERDFDEDDIFSSIKSLGKNKAPGPDGYHIAFLSADLEHNSRGYDNVFSELQDRGFLDWRLKNTFISLTPKKDTMEEVNDRRPISLVNGVYKTLSKVLAKRSEGYFKSMKGIQQGDPLSQFLFLVVHKSLTVIMLKVQANGHLNGFQVSMGGTKISHLQFVDDTLIFLEVNINQVKFLRILVLCFELLTGLHVNFLKSHMYGVDYDGDMSIFTSLLGCYNSTLPITYLELPLGDKYKGSTNGIK
ncbi:uncharacterized protein LOC113296053 [Papaver somniferum]|uniref:uncharacterized protein LOC113296053 n=1 Tax=Papaver somniferum TaxID=3469 RepID=UPI000E6F5E53|nr:uncharacterized protein LOC113296053 [Papaver somniferum]